MPLFGACFGSKSTKQTQQPQQPTSLEELWETEPTKQPKLQKPMEQAANFSDAESEASFQSRAPGGGPRKLFKKKTPGGGPGGAPGGGPENLEDKLVAVIVTISSGTSYDEMFQENQPETVPGERVSTYSLDCRHVDDFRQYLDGSQPIPETETSWLQLVTDIISVTSDSVTFNWECCSECSDKGFPSCTGARQSQGRSLFGRSPPPATPTMELMGLAIRRGFTVMCSDFSLKALISDWSELHLGPNPFSKMGNCDKQFQLEFVPSELRNEEVPQQLQVVGELCAEQGKAVVSAMSDTIVYTVNPRRKETDRYKLKVLTVVSNYHGGNAPSSDDEEDQDAPNDGTPGKDALGQEIASEADTQVPEDLSQMETTGNSASKPAGLAALQSNASASPWQRRRAAPRPSLPEAMMCSIGEGDHAKRGMAGHVALTYAAGGQLVTSMGHWIELTRIDTSLDGVLRVAAHNFGQQEYANLQADLNVQATDFDREQCVQKWAKSHISKSVPTRMKCRTKY